MQFMWVALRATLRASPLRALPNESRWLNSDSLSQWPNFTILSPITATKNKTNAVHYANDMPLAQNRWRKFYNAQTKSYSTNPQSSSTAMTVCPCSTKNNVPTLNSAAKKRGVPEVSEAGVAKKEGMLRKVYATSEVRLTSSQFTKRYDILRKLDFACWFPSLQRIPSANHRIPNPFGALCS